MLKINKSVSLKCRFRTTLPAKVRQFYKTRQATVFYICLAKICFTCALRSFLLL